MKKEVTRELLESCAYGITYFYASKMLELRKSRIQLKPKKRITVVLKHNLSVRIKDATAKKCMECTNRLSYKERREDT